MEKKTIIIGFTGSVASVKADLILSEFIKNYKVIAIFSSKSEYFVNREELTKKYKDSVTLIWESSIELDVKQCEEWAKEADVILIAPASANTMSKLVSGIYDTHIVTPLSNNRLL